MISKDDFGMIAKKPFLLPYAILYRAPLFDMIRAPARYSIMVIVSICVIVGYCLTYIFDKLKKRKFVVAIAFVLICSGIVFE